MPQSLSGCYPPTTAICTVLYFQSRSDVGQLWFRTADIRKTQDGIEWTPVTPPRFEGVVLQSSAESFSLSSLPSLLDSDRGSRPVADVSVATADVVLVPAAPQPGAVVDVTATVRNIGDANLYKALVTLTAGTALEFAGPPGRSWSSPLTNRRSSSCRSPLREVMGS